MTPTVEWNNTEAPEEGAIVRVLVSDEGGEYVIPFQVVFRADSWFNAATGEELAEEIFIEGWMMWDAKPPHGDADAPEA
jgi:hypothetical protein